MYLHIYIYIYTCNVVVLASSGVRPIRKAGIRKLQHTLRIDSRENCSFNMASTNVCILCGAQFEWYVLVQQLIT